jgi:hypothetical protein
MLMEWITPDLITSTLAVATFYVCIYLIVLMWHQQINASNIAGIETLVFFLALDMAIATGRADLSSFLGQTIQLHNKRMIFGAVCIGTLLTVLTSSLLQAAAARLENTAALGDQHAPHQWAYIPSSASVRRVAAWSVRASVGMLHTILLVGFAA